MENFQLGQRIRELRKTRMINQRELAKRANMTSSYLGQLERDEKNPTIGSIEKICAAFDLTLSEFFSEKSGERKVQDQISEEIMKYVRECTDSEKVIILQLIRQVLKKK
ncbi:helix-turn-helix domain-containing protein [Lachnoclostridium sp. An181]|uniref:helix-turn-helix domain-containing protein n=1 Tax=Lachnoclostridium sp. An181 TaxID=1965575 RepID=UPI000B38F49A|nr:helix-turn-helix transcriptional regulator [Lachnoclostridium sp. An181]OUP50358.1 hypothetical protein B5F18_04040 [Lachnoclostridium sp. An181]